VTKRQIVLGITGASGAPYARSLLRALTKQGAHVHVVASRAGKLVYELEVGRPLAEDLPADAAIYDAADFTAPFASGSFQCTGMAIVPCSMGTMGAIANGISRNLIHRAADVCLKERRRLVLVPRETPLNRIHLSNMLRIAEAGGIILPAMPGFYHRPGTVEDLVNFVVARILEQLEMPQNLVPAWDPASLSGVD
jgi:4-hydroxy-3-polyprenylbenzoate decarboxylase